MRTRRPARSGSIGPIDDAGVVLGTSSGSSTKVGADGVPEGFAFVGAEFGEAVFDGGVVVLVQELGVDALQVFGIEARGGAADLGEVELGGEHIERRARFHRIGGADLGEVREHGHRLVAFGGEFADAE
jgi:hypothetical protein